MPNDRDTESSADARDVPSRAPVPRVVIPEPDFVGGPSSRRKGRHLFVAIGVLATAGAVWLGVALGRAKLGARDEPVPFSPDDVTPVEPTPAPAPVTPDSTPARSDTGSARRTEPAPPPAPAPVPRREPPRGPPRAPPRAPSRPAAARPSTIDTQPKVPEPPLAEGSARLIIRAVPGATLYIDDRLIGLAVEMAVPVAPGRHVVRITKPGYRAYTKTVDVAEGEQRRLTDVVLEPER